jgi:hypothetical protein
MADTHIQVSYSKSFTELESLLSGVKRPGDFHSFGAVETAMPKIVIEGVGTLSFPVPPAQAKAIIAAAAERAPYGRGDKTLVDETVRKVWQIAPGKLIISGKAWTFAFADIVQDVADALGCGDASVEAEFYKLLVYDAGAFFVSHRDSEKTGGMFGTLVISLPSEHEGGTLIIRHAGREVRHELRAEEPSEVRYAGFYADCEHEVLPITSGYRVCLIYNLVQRVAKSDKLTAPDHREAVTTIANSLRSWAAQPEMPAKCVYLLEHQYTEAGLSFAALKNGDSALAGVLREAAAQADCALHLGLVHIEESGWAEHTGGGYYGRRRSRYWDDDGEADDDDEYEVGEVCDGAKYIAQWRTPNGTQADFGSIPLADNELIPVGALDDEEPDELHFSEATGNAGADFERTYLRAALVIWPNARFNDVCLAGGMDAAIARIGQLASESRDKAKRSAAITGIEGLLRSIIERWSDDYDGSKQLCALLTHLAAANEPGLFEQIFEPIVLPQYDGKQNETLIACAKLLGGERATPLMRQLCFHAKVRPAQCIDLWLRLTKRNPLNETQLSVVAAELIVHLPQARQEEAPKFKVPYFSRYSGFVDPAKEYAELLRTAESDGTIVTAKQCVNFLTALRPFGDPLLANAVSAAIQNSAVFPVERVLLRAVEMCNAEPEWAAHPQLSRLWAYAADYYLRRSETAPTAPEDWMQEAQISCTCEDCRALVTFARDPLKQVHRFRVKKERRQHLHEKIDAAKLDMTHITDRKGSPQTLVCTKTRTTYENACKQHRADQSDMRRLLALSTSEPRIGDEKLQTRLNRAQAV